MVLPLFRSFGPKRPKKLLMMTAFCAPAVCVRQTCGMAISPAEVRRFDFERYGVPSVRRTVCAGPESTGGFEIAVGIPLTRYPPRGPGRALISASGSYRG